MASGAELALQMIMSLKDEATGKLGDIAKAAKDADKKAGGLKATFDKLAGVGKTAILGGIGLATGAVAGLGAALATTIGPASDLSETVSKVGVVFGDQAAAVLAFGETAAAAMGMTKNEALAAAGTYGNLFRAMGMTETASADMSVGLVGLASDLASFNNMNPNEVLDKLRAGLSGETEPLKSLGVNLNVAAVEAKGMAMGLETVDGKLTVAAKAQATYALVLEQTKLAQGDFARTSGGLANQQRILAATFGNLKTTIGTALLPVVTSLIGAFTGLMTDIMPAVTRAAETLGPILSGIATFVTEAVISFGGLGDVPWEDILPPSLVGTAYAISGALDSISAWWNDKGKPAFDMIAKFVSDNIQPIMIGLAAVLAAVVVPAFISWAIAAGTAAIATLAAIAPFVALAALVALLAKAWIKDWGGIRTFLTNFYERTLKPIIEQIIKWFQENVPRAIETVSKFWTNTLLPAIRTVVEWIKSDLVPILQTIWNWLATNIPAAIATVSGFWNNTLLPAIRAVWGFINDSLLPLFKSIADFMNAAFSLAITALAGLWEKVLLPAIQTASNWIKENVLPVLQDIAKWINDNVVPALQKFADILNGALKTALTWVHDNLIKPLITSLEKMPGIIEKITGWFGTFAGKLDALKDKLPAWLTPGSPTPLEIGLRGLSDALFELLPQWIAFGRALGDASIKGMDKLNKVMNDMTEIIKDVAGALKKLAEVTSYPDVGSFGEFLKALVTEMVNALVEVANDLGMAGIDAAASMNESVTSIMGIVGPAVSAVTSLAGVDLEALGQLDVKWSLVQSVMMFMVTKLVEIAKDLDMTGYPAAELFAESAGKIVAVVGPAVSAVVSLAGVKLEDLKLVGVKWSWVETAILWIIQNIVAIVARLDMSGYPAAVAFAESAGKIVALIEPSVSAVVSLAGVKVEDLQGVGVKWSWVATAIFYIAGQLALMTAKLNDDVLDQAERFKKVCEGILDGLKAGLGILTAIGEADDPKSAMGALVAFSESAKLSMGNAVKAVQDALAQLNGIFRGSTLISSATSLGERMGSAIVSGLRSRLASGGDILHGMTMTVSGVQWFAGGGDFIARRPQLIGVGEAGPERVTVTPLGQGGAGQGVNFTYNDYRPSGAPPDPQRMAAQLEWYYQTRRRR